MPTSLRLTALLAAFSLLAASASAQVPINDESRTAKPIWAEQFSYVGTNVEATASPVDAGTAATCVTSGFDSNLAVWWAFSTTSAGPVTIDLGQSSFDTIVSVISAGDGELACNDDDPDNGGDDFSSKVTVSLDPGLYFVRVSGHTNDPQGTIQLSVSGSLSGTDPIDGPPNDIATAELLGLLPNAVHPDTNVGASVYASDPFQTCSNAGSLYRPVWRAFRAPADGAFTVDTNGSDYDTVVEIYTVEGGAYVPQGCNDDDPNGTDNSSLVTIPVTENTVYFVQTAAFQPTGQGGLLYTTTFAPTVASEQTPAGEVSLTAAPNPVRDAAAVTLSVPTAQAVTVEVFDVTGRRVATLHNGEVAAGALTLDLDASALPSGVYVVRAVGETVSLSERLTVVR